MDNVDIRWKQRFQNFEKAYKRLNHAIVVVKGEPDNEVLTAGLIQTYEFTFVYLKLIALGLATPGSTRFVHPDGEVGYTRVDNLSTPGCRRT